MKTFSEYIELLTEAMSDEARALQDEKGKLYRKIRGMKQRGKDTTALEKEYEDLCARYELAKNTPAGKVPPTTTPKIDVQGIKDKLNTVLNTALSQIQTLLNQIGAAENIDNSERASIEDLGAKLVDKNPQKFSELLDKCNADYESVLKLAEQCEVIDKKLAEKFLSELYNLTNKVQRAKSAIHKPQAQPKINTKSADYQAGYEAAMKALEEAAKKNQNGANSGADGLGVPSDPEDSQDQNNSPSRDAGSDGSQGTVRPADCGDPSGSLQSVPDTAGGMISKEDGDKLAEAEGYSKEGGNEKGIDKDWEERAKQAASKMAGKGAGWDIFVAKINNLYKVTKDWKKELRNIVGHSINADDKRSAYANKNVLVSQNRIARTDKDKYDCSDFMVAAIDTSGSMTQEFLEACLREVYQVALAKKPLKLVVCQFDTRVADVQTYTSIPQLLKDIKKFKLKGGGGTNVKPVFDMLKTDKQFRGRRADLVMIFTDGYLTQYKRDARTMQNLCWIVIDNPGFNLQNKDVQTKCVRINMADIK